MTLNFAILAWLFLCFAFVMWLAVRAEALETAIVREQAKSTLRAMQAAADLREARMREINDEAIRSAEATLARAYDTLERTNALLDSMNKPRSRGGV